LVDLSDKASRDNVKRALASWQQQGFIRVTTHQDGKRMARQFIEVVEAAT